MRIPTEGYPMTEEWPSLLRAQVILGEQRRRYGEPVFQTPFSGQAFGDHLPPAHVITRAPRPYQEQFTTTVATPLAVRLEAPETLFHTLQLVDAETEEMGRTQVHIWGNDRLPISLRDKIDSSTYDLLHSYNTAREEMQRLLEEWVYDLRGLSFVYSAVFMNEGQDVGGGVFNFIRSHYMERMLFDAFIRRQTADQPMFWLDADTPTMRRGSLAKMRHELMTEQAHVVRATLHLVGDDPLAPPFGTRSDAEKTTAVYALARRMIERNLGPYDARGYVDESGMGMKLGTYALAGGVGLNDPARGESRTLLERIDKARVDGLLADDIPTLKFISDAVIGNSYRRFRTLASAMPAHILPLSQEGPDYLDYQSLTREILTPTSVGPSYGFVPEDALRMVDAMVELQKNRGTVEPLTAVQHRHLGSVVSRFATA